MAIRKRKKPVEKILYFYLDGKLYKALHKNRAEDLLIVWDYEQEKRIAFSLSQVQKNKKTAYSVSQAAKMMNRSVDTIKRHWRAGEIRKPYQTYSLDGQHRPNKYFFSEDNIREMHEFFKTVHRGRPRNDGLITNSDTPSAAELEALMRNEKVLYTKNDQGEYVPVWKQPEW
jgi:hypothetical protein